MFSEQTRETDIIFMETIDIHSLRDYIIYYIRCLWWQVTE